MKQNEGEVERVVDTLFHIKDSIDCSCEEEPDALCWYHMSEVQQRAHLRESVVAALAAMKPAPVAEVEELAHDLSVAMEADPKYVAHYSEENRGYVWREDQVAGAERRFLEAAKAYADAGTGE